MWAARDDEHEPVAATRNLFVAVVYDRVKYFIIASAGVCMPPRRFLLLQV